MKAMILAAGHGTRMRPLTDHTPKPLLEVAGKPLIAWHLEKLKRAGFYNIVINIAWLGQQIPAALGDGSAFGLSIQYSDEQQEGALETAGGIVKALDLLGNQPFLVISGDVWCDYDVSSSVFFDDTTLAHLVLVDNPEHHPKGDFACVSGRLHQQGKVKYTFSGIGYYQPELFIPLRDAIKQGKVPKQQPIGALLRATMDKGLVSGEYFTGDWRDIGTPERLLALEKDLKHF
ncbi:MAG: nucleotidyltransferase family protein [Cocleimonas sp.]|nr:nucleotidyltransferase family protein [Cocleimonas sp.]